MGGARDIVALSMGSHKSPPSPGEARSVMDSLRRLVHGLRIFDRAAERTAGMSGAQLFVLSKLEGGGAATVNELAERTCTHQSSVSVVADKLVKRGLARRERVAEDGRRVLLSITRAGKTALARAPEAAQDKLIDAIDRLIPAERGNLARLLENLVAAADLAAHEPTLFFEDRQKRHRSRWREEKK
jgi:DNA-binding MarR family transcriptional regulator